MLSLALSAPGFATVEQITVINRNHLALDSLLLRLHFALVSLVFEPECLTFGLIGDGLSKCLVLTVRGERGLDWLAYIDAPIVVSVNANGQHRVAAKQGAWCIGGLAVRSFLLSTIHLRASGYTAFNTSASIASVIPTIATAGTGSCGHGRLDCDR